MVACLMPVAHAGGPLTAGDHFWNLLLTDTQLLDRLRARWPDLKVARDMVVGQNSWTSAPLPPLDCWIVRFSDAGTVQQLAVPVEPDRRDGVWIAYRYALYCCYVHLLSGGAS